ILVILYQILVGTTSRKVGHEHVGIGYIDRLTARARGTENVEEDDTYGDVELGRILHERDDLDRREARLALVCGSEGADAREAVRARLDGENAVGVGRVDLERRRLDARALRSEERRVGKERRSEWRGEQAR